MYPKILIFLFISLLLTSCFEIREEVNLKTDGSGEVTMIANMSESKGKIRQYLKMERVEGYYVPKPHEIKTMLAQAKSILGEVEGITYVQLKEDWSNFIFSISARFDNVEALNEAVRLLSEKFKHLGMPEIEAANFSYENEQFQRHFDYPPEPEQFEALPPVQQRMFESARMISIYRFEQLIQNFSNEKAATSPSGRAIMLQVPLADLSKGKASLANVIEF